MKDRLATPALLLLKAAIMVSAEMDYHAANRSETPSSAARRCQADENAVDAAFADDAYPRVANGDVGTKAGVGRNPC